MSEEKLYKCEDCGLHYENKETATECYEFCTEFHACSLEITKKSIEYRENQKKSQRSQFERPSLQRAKHKHYGDMVLFIFVYQCAFA